MSKEKIYSVKSAVGVEVPLSGEVSGTPWEKAMPLQVDTYNWYKSGDKQATTIRVLYDDKALYFQALCEDKHIFSKTTKLNGSVCLDSCVEIFASPNPEKEPHYFNLEINCCGVFHLGFGPDRQRILISEELAKGIKIVTSEKGPTREESPDDKEWWVAAKIPYEVLSKFTGRDIAPVKGSVWRANFYRCGGKTDDQYASWTVIPVANPDYHRPEAFGKVVFD